MKLLNLEIDIIEEDGTKWARNTLGNCDTFKSLIMLQSGMKKDLKDQTLVHEVVHIVSEMAGVNLKEKEVLQLTLGIFSFIKDNPKIIKNMLKEE